jgi:hypothetical protein
MSTKPRSSLVGHRIIDFKATPARRWLILKLLDDDFLSSIMNHEKYEVNSKEYPCQSSNIRTSVRVGLTQRTVLRAITCTFPKTIAPVVWKL